MTDAELDIMSESISETQRKMLFHQEIEELNKKHDSYIDSIVEFCDKSGIEAEDITPLISVPLMEKIKNEAHDMNLLKTKRNFFSIV